MWHSGLFFLLLVASVAANIDKKHSKYVTTLINAKWNETPIVLEIAEYINEKNPIDFWKFIDAVCDDNNKNSIPKTEKEEYDRSILLAGKFLSEAEIALLKLSLSLRIYSARVEMFSQMAENKEKIINATRNKIINCHNFIDIAGEYACQVDEIDNYLSILKNKEFEKSHESYSIDHQYPISSQASSQKIPTIVFYGQIGTDKFTDLHRKLKTLADEKKILYILRHNVKERPDNLLRLSGYGVELQMKSTEYKATDDADIKDNSDKSDADNNSEGFDEIEGFNFGVLKKLYPDKQKELDELQNHLLETSDEVGALKVWQFQELSHQAAERIVSSSPQNAINVMSDISQNFPMQAKSLIRIKVDNKMKKEMKNNQELFFSHLHIQPSDTAFFINGLFFDLDAIDVLSLLETLRTELIVMESLHKIGFNNKKMDKLLAIDLSTSSNSDHQDFAINIRDSAIVWINDLENDKRYNKWSSSLMALLRPTFPGMLRNIRRNLYNLVLIIDPLSELSIPLLTTIETLNAHSAPIRVGFVFVTSTSKLLTGLNDPSIAVNNAYHYLAQKKNHMEAVKFITLLLSKKKTNDDEASTKLTVDDVKKALLSCDSSADIDYIFDEESEYDIGRYLAYDFIQRTGFKKFPQALLNGVPLPSASTINAETFEETVLSSILGQTPMLQKAVYKGEVTDGANIIDFIMEQPNVMPRLNEKILKSDTSQWLNLIGRLPVDNNVDDVSNWSPEDTAAWIMTNSKYLFMTKRNNKKIRHNHSYWIVLNLESEDGRQLLREAFEHLESTIDSRLTLIINSNSKNLEKNSMSINKLALSILNTKKDISREKLIFYMQKLIKEDNVEKIKNGEFDYKEYAGILNENEIDDNEFLLKVHKHYVESVIDDNLSTNGRAVICNGRVIGPLDDDEKFTREDFSLLEKYSQSTYGEKLDKIINDMETTIDVDDDDEDDEDDLSREKKISDDVLMQIASLLVPRQQTRSRYEIPSSGEEYSVVKVPAKDKKKVAFNLIAIVDPVSRGAQKLGSILDTLQKSINCNIKIYLNCVDKNSDMPLKSFYRFVFDPELQFSNDGKVSGSIAKFTKLPTSSLLTQYIHAPENWLVQVVQSVYDLDNIKLDNVAIGVHSEYELEHLLLEGHCFEATMGNPPRGLQITLGTEIQSVMVDTIVMANLGYFQLKANPGEWMLRLRLGRSADIYDIHSVDGQDAIQNGNEVRVLISSLKSHVLKLKVTKKPDKMAVDLLGEDDKKSGLWNSISRTFGSEDGEEQEEKINIFSLASGHLYERFLKIMMLSVLKNTKNPVKFWFLKNYLSPTLKDFLPHMAEEYGFEYELVEYKWPRWLHQQTEKQRTIWGYKILFLDVLFPLDVKKIIFVDADQVVRADLKELVELDLEGAPYAYTPFCDSRREMDGFRFWKQGYWKTHLQGRSYHISALYVVDLQRFRKIAAGDRLRGQYQALSPDPNSLSNLDQDLPNNMIHQVAIKTLPQDWLWCETWCSDKSKKYAKTIDLCNNPQTKEAKLQAAIRILPEWTGYDEEIKKLQQKIEDSNKLHEKEDKENSDDAESRDEL